MPPSPTRKNDSLGVLWLVGSRLGTVALSLLSTAVLARFLGPEDFGRLVPATIAVALAASVFDGAFGVSLIRRESLDGDHIASTLGNALLLGFGLTLALVLSAPFIGAFFQFKDLTEIVLASSVVILFKSIFSVATALMQRKGDFRSIALVALFANPIGSLLFAVPLATMHLGVWALVIGLIVSGMFEAGASAVLAKLPLRIKVSRDTIRELGSTEGYLAANQILNWVALSSANIVAGHTLGAAPLGHYSRGWRLLDIATSATSAPIQRVLLPRFSRLQNDLAQARASFEDIIGLLAPGFAILGVMVCLHAEAIVRLLLGGRWLATVPVVQILFSALLARCTYKVSESVAVAFGRARASASRQAIYAVLMVAGAILGARYNEVGIALGTSVAVWIFYLLSISQAVQLLESRWQVIFAHHVRAGALSLLMVLLHGLFSELLLGRGFWISEIATGVLVMAATAVVIAIAPTWAVGAPVKSLRDGIFRRLSKTRVAGSGPEAAVYVYAQSLPNSAANSGAVLSLCSAMSKSGAKISVAHIGSAEAEPEIRRRYDLAESIALISAPKIKGPISYFALTFRAIAKSPRNATVLTRAPQVAVICCLLRRPVVLELHQDLDTYRNWKFWRLPLRLTRKPPLVVVALSRSIIDNLDPAVSNRAKLVEKAASAAPDLRSEAAAPQFDVGYVGSFLAGKGIEVVTGLAQRRPDLRFVIYGDPRKNPGQAEQLSLLPNVHVAGYVARSDLASAFATFRIGLAPYSPEGFAGGKSRIATSNLSSLKVVEYLSAGNIVVASRVDGIANMVEDGVEALLCDPYDLDDWSRALDRLVKETDLGPKLAARGRALFERNFTYDTRAKIFLAAMCTARGS